MMGIDKLRSVGAWIRNALLDLRYGGLLAGSIQTRHGKAGAYDVANVQYAVLPDIFDERVKCTDVIVDMGCGKGRVINWLLSRGVKSRIVGIELDEEVASRTKRRLSRYRNVEIITGDAVENLPADGTVFFLFNPFNAEVMSRFKQRLLEMFGKSGGITILYYAPIHLDVFLDDPNWEIEQHDVSRAHQDPRFIDRHRRFAVIRLRKPYASSPTTRQNSAHND